MSHLDELDEFEAELELRLKREYTAVFRLFRYCVLTQDATYLCNKLDLKVVPQASYPFFHAEDGGRLGLGQEPADADHPARRGLHLERRHVEELRGEGDEPRAHRRGARRAARRDPLARTTNDCASSGEPAPPCTYARADAPRRRRRQHADRPRALRRRAARRALARRDRGGRAPATSSACCSAGCSTSDAVDGDLPLARRCRRSSASTSGSRSARRTRRSSSSGPGVQTGIPIRYDDPREVGPDRIVNAVAAKERYGAPCIVVDFGTSTNFDVVSPAGEYVGGVLAPGIEISMDALFARAARLVQGRLRRAARRVIGKTTVAGAPVRARLRLRRPGGRDRRPRSAGELGAGGAGGRDRRARRADRAALARRSSGRPVPDARGPPARLGAEPVIRSRRSCSPCRAMVVTSTVAAGGRLRRPGGQRETCR